MIDLDKYALFHRKIYNNPVCWKNAEHFAVWSYLILNAKYEEHTEKNGKKEIVLKPGQVLKSFREIARDTKVPKSTVERIINFFEKNGQVGTVRNGYKVLISLNNWDFSQKRWDSCGTNSGTVQTQTTKGKTDKCGTVFGTANNNKHLYISDLENLFDEIIQNFSPEFRTENDKTIFLDYFKGIENENEIINMARRMQSALNKMPEQSRPLAEFIKQWKTRKT